MAITKMLHINTSLAGSGSHLVNSLDYISKEEKVKKSHMENMPGYIFNEDKTDSYVGSMNCRMEHAVEDMRHTKELYGKTDGRQAYHFIISFKPGETDEETAWKIIQEFVKEYLPEYESVFSLHTDTDHLHGHIVCAPIRGESKSA